MSVRGKLAAALSICRKPRQHSDWIVFILKTSKGGQSYCRLHVFLSQARRCSTNRWAKCASLCLQDVQRFVLWPWMAMARNNEQSRAGRGDVKIFTHQTIWLPLLSLLPHSHFSSFSFFVFFFSRWGKNVLLGAAWQMKMRKREKWRPERKKRGGGGKWKVVLKCFATLVGFSFLTFQFKQTICWLGDVPSVVIEGGEWLQLAEK